MFEQSDCKGPFVGVVEVWFTIYLMFLYVFVYKNKLTS